MEPIPIPAQIHYELPLQLLERQTRLAVSDHSLQSQQVQELIITLRKAIALHKQLEKSCEQDNLPIEHRWALNDVTENLGLKPRPLA